MDVSLSLCDVETECLCMHAGKLYIIDYEYGSYSYRGYDIANHFNEYAGFECDYSLYVCSSLPIFLCIYMYNWISCCIHLLAYQFNVICCTCSCIVSSCTWGRQN
jgi:hypothetical protein